MQIWKLTKTLSNPKNPAWEMFVKLTLGEDVHADRINSFRLSREALLLCLKDAQISADINDLTLTNYSTLERFPQLTVSLSHTKEAGAALIADRQTFRSVGIDIEHEARVVKDSIIERVSNSLDLRLRNIELWCLKEAVFKTLMNSGKFEKPIEFSSIVIEEKTWSHSPSGLKGEWELEVITPFVIARSFLKN